MSTPQMPTDVGRVISLKNAANQGALDEALRAEYETGLHSRLADRRRMEATWDASYLVLAREVKLNSVLQTAIMLLHCEHGALTMIDQKAAMLVKINVPPVSFDIKDSYCQHVSDGTPFRVDDAEGNSLVCTVSGTTELGMRSYLGVPIVFDAMVVGSLCVFDMQVREWTTGDVRVLAALAQTVEQVLTERDR